MKWKLVIEPRSKTRSSFERFDDMYHALWWVG
jgi:hypothetical protein